MNQFLKVIGLAGLLVLILTVRAWAAPELKPVSIQGGINTPQLQATPMNPGQTGQATGGWGGRMGGGHMGRGRMGSRQGAPQGHMGMSAGSGNSMPHETMMAGVTPMHDDVAMQFGMTSEDLYHQMANGFSLMQIAAEKGITEQQLMDGIMAGRHTAYGQAVMDGYMTQAQADTMLQNLNNNLKMMVNDQGSESTGWGMMWGAQPSGQSQYRMHH